MAEPAKKRIFQPNQRKSVLLVDDPGPAAEALREALARSGFGARLIDLTSELPAQLEAEPFQLIVLDLSLAKMDGLEILQNIRAQVATTPIFVLTNPFLGKMERAALQAGASKALKKNETAPDAVAALVRSSIGPSHAPLISPPLSISREQALEKSLHEAHDFLAYLRTAHQHFVRATSTADQHEGLRQMHGWLLSLGDAARLAGVTRASQLAEALEAFVTELHQRPEQITPSALRTLAQAIDTLGFAFSQTAEGETAAKILVVDDDPVSREMIAAALARAGLKATTSDDPLAARDLLATENFDLIFLDFEMPGLNGPELCKQIREMENYRSTPVVFVTAHSGFATRAQSSMSGGNDFIGKPFLAVELAIKALTHLAGKKSRVLTSATTTSRRDAPREFAHAGS